MPRLVGLSLYRVDINFRESAVVGIVGAGGIGATLNAALDRYEFDSAAAILIIIKVRSLHWRRLYPCRFCHSDVQQCRNGCDPQDRRGKGFASLVSS